MQKSFPFNAVMTDSGYDRIYSAEDFAAERAAYISDGILQKASLKVTPVSGRTVCISEGKACIRGRTYWNDSPLNMTLDISHATYPRIDRIVLRLSYTGREILLQLKKGIPAANPAAPDITDDEEMCEIPIAKITVGANMSVISEAAIEDERVLSSFPLDYDEIVMEYTQELRDELGTADLSRLKDVSNAVIVNGSGRNALFDDGIYKPAAVLTEAARFTSNGTFSTYAHPSKDNLYHVVLLGGGGGGSARYIYTTPYLVTGGGSGALFNMGPIYIPPGNYPVVVGAGGGGVAAANPPKPGNNGGDTSAFGYTAGGGKGGRGSANVSTSTEYDVKGTGFCCYPGQDGAKKEDGGKGGSTLYGSGGAGNTADSGNGANASGYGAGGGCGGDSGRGGNGTGGIAIIYAYA